MIVPEILLERIEREYDEQPGLNLTPEQAQRLWGLDHPTCRAALSTLEDGGRSSPTSHTGRTIGAVWIESLRAEFAPVHEASHSGKQRSRASIAT
jgi:hypothetical protein